MYVHSACEHRVKVCLWTAKSCIVPTKVHSESRLELMGKCFVVEIVSVKLAVEKMLRVTKVVLF